MQITEVTKDRFEIQDAQYDFPYHYIPYLDEEKGPQVYSYLDWGSDSRGRALLLYEGSGNYPALVFGYDLMHRRPSDVPIRAKVRSLFRDPVIGAVKTIFAGPSVEACGQLNIECGTFGHFWYSPDECLEKVKRWTNEYRFSYTTRPIFNERLPSALWLGFNCSLF